MRQNIVIQLGNRGANIGSSFWKQISAEHGIENHSLVQTQSENIKIWTVIGVHFFTSKMKTRLCRDLSSLIWNRAFVILPSWNTLITTLSIVTLWRIIDSDKLNNEEKSQIEAVIQKQLERCDYLEQCLFIRDCTEDTSRILSYLDLKELGIVKQRIIDCSIVADRTSTDEQLINSTLSYNLFTSYHGTSILYQDTAIQRQVHSKNQHSKIDLNRFVAKTLSSFTLANRVDLKYCGRSPSDMSNNGLLPYPRIIYAVPSLVTTYDTVSMPCEIDSVQSLVENAIHNSSLLCDVDVTAGYYIAAYLFVRGLSTKEIQQSMQSVRDKKKCQFTPICPAVLLAGTDSYANMPCSLKDTSVCAALLHTSVRSIFQLWNSKIDQMAPNALQKILAQKNISEVEFNEAFDDMKALILDFGYFEEIDEVDDNDLLI